MPRLDVNRFAEMTVFVTAVEQGSFSAAGRSLGMTPSAVSKLVGRLEARLGMQLVLRSTRKLQLTPEGQQFHERSLRLLADLDETERGVTAGAPPRGLVVINTSVSFGVHVLAPLVPALMTTHPHVAIDLALTDRVVDLMDERADIAVRWGVLRASDLVARRLGETGVAIVASPDYLKRHGTPRTPEQLAQHRRLDFTYRRRAPHWPLRVEGRIVELPVTGGLRASDGEAIRHLVLAGAGLARLSLYQVWGDLAAGRLVKVMERHNPHEREPIHAMYLGRPDRLPSRVRVVLDFLVEQLAVDPRFNPSRGLSPRS